MRKLPTHAPAVHPTPTSLIRLQRHVIHTCRPARASPLRPSASHPHRPFFSTPPPSLAQLRSEPFTDLWFTSSSPQTYPSHPPAPPERSSEQEQEPDQNTNHEAEMPPPPKNSDHNPPSARTLALGRTLRELSPLLPSLLLHPLPPHLLSPHITLHLFPSTHPHLPTVKGRVAYRAALWTAPVAWGRLPIVGNVKLQILSERVVRTGWAANTPTSEDENSDEKLVVRWRTESKTPTSAPTQKDQPTISPTSSSSATDPTNRGLSSLLGGDQPLLRLPKDPAQDTFSGLFIFGFDEEGRIISHTIEHTDEGTGWDRTARVVSLTDWLLGKAKGNKEKEVEWGLAYEGTAPGEWEGWGRGSRDELWR
jgi:hypothetical protein